MDKTAIHAEGAPGAVGPYSHAVSSNGFLFCSGQVGIDPRTGKMVAGGIAAQTEQVMQNVITVLAAAGCGLGDVVKVTAFLTDMTEFAQFNEIYGQHFPQPYPARSAIGVTALPAGARVEIEVLARLNG